MLPLLQSELFRFRRRAMPWIMLLILAAIIVGLYVLLWAVTHTQPEGMSARDLENQRDGLRLHSVREFGFALTQQFGSVLAVIVGATAISNEFSWGTIRTMLPRASSRFAFLSAKLLLVAIFVLVLTTAGLVFALAGSGVATALAGSGGGLDQRFAVGAAFGIARTAYVMLPYVALAFVVSTWTRSTAAGIAVGLVVLFLEGIGAAILNSFGGFLADVTDLLIARNVSAIMAANRASESTIARDTDDLPGLLNATMVLAVWTAAFVALAYRRFLTRDITSG